MYNVNKGRIKEGSPLQAKSPTGCEVGAAVKGSEVLNYRFNWNFFSI